MESTRSSAEVSLLRMGTDELSNSHLPADGDVLKLMMKFLNDEKGLRKRRLNWPCLKSWQSDSMQDYISVWTRVFGYSHFDETV